jgi:argininosuccinate lyase
MTALTGRISGVPADVLHEEVLAPQFAYEAGYLLPWYVAVEKVLLLEYRRMGLASGDQIAALAARLHEVTPDLVRADPAGNLSDIAFALERHVDGEGLFPAWHVDRSRNDLQAAAQLLAARDWTLDAVGQLLDFGRAVGDLAARYPDTPMPGYTHLQAAQIITPGFHLAALGAETLRTLHRLRLTYGEMDASPLGAGAMAGQELPWDRQRMAALLGFGRVQPHALVAVASRGWALSVTADLAGYGVTLSRFATDLMAWGSSAYGFIDLPDSLSGISSAMPQKKNFPILERVRGRSAHLSAYHFDVAMGQRATPYANMVEVSKEAGANVRAAFEALRSLLRLFGTVVANLRFRPDRMRAACERDYLGGFTLANLLALRCGVPWRAAQVIAGRYVVAAIDRGLLPTEPDGDLLATVGDGYRITDPAALLAEAFSVDGALRAKTSPGGTGPAAVRELLADQADAYDDVTAWWEGRRAAIQDARVGIDQELGLA